jgi:hypothetical protein
MSSAESIKYSSNDNYINLFLADSKYQNLSRVVELEEKRCFGEGEGMRPSNTC